MMGTQTKMQEEPNSSKMTLEQYFEMEYRSPFRHEYMDGQAQRMAYTSENHGTLVSKLNRLIGNCLLNKACRVYASDRMVYVPGAECNNIYYPDLVIACDPVQRYQYSKNMVATMNPSIIIEVLSDSTENEDRHDKWQCYRKILSLKQYILVSQKHKFIQIINRTEKSSHWLVDEFEHADEIISILDCQFSLREVYAKVEI